MNQVKIRNHQKLHKCLTKKGWLLADGATGTNLFKKGLETGYPPELWNIEAPQKISALHKEFVEAGADIILTNTFGGNSLRLKLHNAENRVKELNIASAKLAREAADSASRDVLVAGSIGPTGELFSPLGTLDMTEAEAVFSQQAQALVEGGVDLLQIETMSSLEEVEAAVRASIATGFPVFVTMTFDTAGRSMMGVSPDDFAHFVGKLRINGFGANCGIGPAELLHSVDSFKDIVGIPIIAKGNCGIPRYIDGEIHYHGTPELMAKYAVLARDAGAEIIGGCCGTTPQHIKAMANALNNTPKGSRPDKNMLERELGKAWKELSLAQLSKDKQKRRNRRSVSKKRGF
tara:strand:+ start:448 stop:1488 length:1041 start_codon:yes stop_codon:yes gene_type:complete